MRAGYCCRQAFALTAVGLLVLVQVGCGGGKDSPDDNTGPDTNASLSSLVLSAGTLDPAFSKDVTSYSADVAFAYSSVTVTPTAESGKATITVNDQPVQSGAASQAITLTVGSNDIEVVVTAEDGTTTQPYSVSVSRQESLPNIWVEIIPGTDPFPEIFKMGSPETEAPGYRYEDEVQHDVKLTHRFEIRSTEVTQAEYESLMGTQTSHFESSCGSGGTTNCPVEQVTWHEAAAYCNALSGSRYDHCYKLTTVADEYELNPAYTTPYECPGYRLPTEAEWEYAARAGTTTATYNGDLGDGQLGSEQPNVVLDPIAWFHGNSSNETHAVGKLQANAWGLYDMLGNVWEWCHDWYGGYEITPSPIENPMGPPTYWFRVIRGGSWYDYAGGARAACRNSAVTGSHIGYLGLRPVRSLP